MSLLDTALDYITSKRSSLDDQKTTLTTIQQSDASAQAGGPAVQNTINNVLGSLKSSPLAQLGEDFVAEQVATNGYKIMDTATGQIEQTVNNTIGIPLRKTVQDANDLLQSSIAAAFTAQNDLQLYFMQQLAGEIVKLLQEKETVIAAMIAKHQELHNALMVMLGGQPFFSPYLENLRQALIKLYDAQGKIQSVRNIFFVSEVFSNIKYTAAQNEIRDAISLIVPPQGPPLADKDRWANPSNGFFKLADVGIPTKPQQLTALIAVPKYSGELAQLEMGYFYNVLKINAMLLAFCVGAASLTNTKAKFLKTYSVKLLDTLNSTLDDILISMSKQLNGAPDAINGPIDEYQPDSVKTVVNALAWIMELKTLLEFSNFVPGSSLKAINTSNDALKAYQDAITKINNLNNRRQGNTVLIVTAGREQFGLLEKQSYNFILLANQAIINGNLVKARSKDIVSMSTGIHNLLLAAQALDSDLIRILQEFQSVKLAFPDQLKQTGDGIKKLLGDFGADKALAALQGGDFASFFNMDSKTMTYAGAALAALTTLKNCLSTEEDQAQLDSVVTQITEDNTAKQLLTQRNSTTTIEQQKREIDVQDKQLDQMEHQLKASANKCGIPEDMQPGTLMQNLGPILAIQVGGFAAQKISGETVNPNPTPYVTDANNVSSVLSKAVTTVTSLGKGIL